MKVVPLHEVSSGDRRASSRNKGTESIYSSGNLSPMTSASKYIENRMDDIDELIIARRNEFSALRQSNKLKFGSVNIALPTLKVGSSIPVLIRKTATITSPLPPNEPVAFTPLDDELYILKNEAMFLRSQLTTKSALLAELQREAAAKSSRTSAIEMRLDEYVNYSENLRQELDGVRASYDSLKREMQERQLNKSNCDLSVEEFTRMKEEWEISSQHNHDLQYQLNERDNDLNNVYDKYTKLEDTNEQLFNKLKSQLSNTDALLRLAHRSRERALLLKHYFCRLQLNALSKERTQADLSEQGKGLSTCKKAEALAETKSSTHILCFLAVFQCSVLYAMITTVMKLL